MLRFQIHRYDFVLHFQIHRYNFVLRFQIHRYDFVLRFQIHRYDFVLRFQIHRYDFVLRFQIHHYDFVLRFQIHRYDFVLRFQIHRYDFVLRFQIHRYSTLSSLYSQIGFERKAAFFKRVAGMQCVTDGTSTGWHQCYYLLLQALHGYNLTLDAKQFLKGKPCYCDTSGMDTTSPSTLSSSSKVSRVTVTRLVWIQPHP